MKGHFSSTTKAGCDGGRLDEQVAYPKLAATEIACLDAENKADGVHQVTLA